jgi:hypothetical protein
VIDGLDDVTVVKEIRDKKKSQFVEDWQKLSMM